jgi:hypothetical protein
MDKWNHCVENSVNTLPYAYSWYLDTVSHSWNALVADDYVAVFPLTARKKYGIHYLFQPPFTQQLGLFSNELLTDEIVNRFLQSIPAKYRLIEIKLNRFNNPDPNLFPVTNNVNLELPLISSYEDIRKSYSKNLKRNLKKAEKSSLSVAPQVNPVEVIRMFQLNRGRDIKSITDDDYKSLEQLIYKMAKRGYAQVSGVFTERNSLCAAAIFMKTDDRIIFLFSGLNEEGRQVAAMPFLIDWIIRKYAGHNIILDFEGSNDPNLARFYGSFGAHQANYPGIKINKLPFMTRAMLKMLKKIR